MLAATSSRNARSTGLNKEMEKRKVLLLDGYNLAFRAFYAMPELTRSDGFPTGAIHGWVKTLWKLEDLEKPEVMAVFFDEGGASEREALLATYKANRSEMPEPLRQQIPVLRRVAELMGCPVFSRRGVEADDLIASVAVRLASEGFLAIMVSADKDLGQCLGPGIEQCLPAPTANPKLGWRRLNAESLEAKIGVKPSQVIDYLALIGDSSDNIPGLDGVGPKTAAKWLATHGSIDGILEAAATLTPKRFREKLPEAADRLRLNQQLVRLDTTLDVGPVEAGVVNWQGLEALLAEMEMPSSIRDLDRRRETGLFNLESGEGDSPRL